MFFFSRLVNFRIGAFASYKTWTQALRRQRLTRPNLFQRMFKLEQSIQDRSFHSVALLRKLQSFLSLTVIMSESNQTSNNDISMRQDPNSTDTTDLPPNVIALNIKSLEQQTKPVRVSRDASVLDLKQAVQTAFQVESGRQRLIFQGRVLKDEKTLADYGMWTLCDCSKTISTLSCILVPYATKLQWEARNVTEDSWK